jgi:hypothetical protein
VVLRASNNDKLAGTGMARHGLVNIGRVMGCQVVPNEDAMVIHIHPLHPKLLNLVTDMITKITKDWKKAADVCGVGWIIFCSKTGLCLTGMFWERYILASSYWAEMPGLHALHLFT